MRMKLCAKCQKMIEAPNRYCDKCKTIVQKQIDQQRQQSNARYNKQRDKKYSQFYNSKDWRTLSKTYLTKHYLCEECQKEAELNNKYSIQIAEQVHHKEPIQTTTGWLRRLDESNLIALCKIHHNAEHKRFGGRR